MCNCEKTLEANKKMFEGFNFDDVVLNYDGYICKEQYEKADKKIVFILKESYTDDIERFQNKDERNSITWLLCNAISNGGKFVTNSQMFDKLGIMGYALLNDEYDVDKIDEDTIQQSLLEVAYLNISKEVLVREENESKESHNKELNENFNKYKELLKKQLEILNPDIIVACGKIGNDGILGKIVKDVFNENIPQDNGEIELDLWGDKVKILYSHHPAYIQKREEFIKALKEKLDNLSKN